MSVEPIPSAMQGRAWFAFFLLTGRRGGLSPALLLVSSRAVASERSVAACAASLCASGQSADADGKFA